jgi:hypothetical protein
VCARARTCDNLLTSLLCVCVLVEICWLHFRVCACTLVTMWWLHFCVCVSACILVTVCWLHSCMCACTLVTICWLHSCMCACTLVTICWLHFCMCACTLVTICWLHFCVCVCVCVCVCNNHHHWLDSPWWALTFLRSFVHSALSKAPFLQFLTSNIFTSWLTQSSRRSFGLPTLLTPSGLVLTIF